MRTINITFSIFIALIIFPLNDSYGAGRWNTAATLMDHCNATLKLQDVDNPTHDEHVKSVGCLSYLEGIKQFLYEEYLLMEQRNICFPEVGISNGQAARIVVNYLEEFPDKLPEHKLQITLEAFSYAFPCE